MVRDRLAGLIYLAAVAFLALRAAPWRQASVSVSTRSQKSRKAQRPMHFATFTPSGSTDSRHGPQTSARRSCWPPKKVGSASGHDANGGESHSTIKEVAKAENINPSYVSRALRLTLLAPTTVEAILDGRANA